MASTMATATSEGWTRNLKLLASSGTINGRFAASNAEGLRDATLAGFGIARLATFLVSDDLRAGRLVPILGDVDADGAPIRAVYPSSRHLSPKVRTFIDALLDAWRPEPPWDVV